MKNKITDAEILNWLSEVSSKGCFLSIETPFQVTEILCGNNVIIKYVPATIAESIIECKGKTIREAFVKLITKHYKS